MRCSQLTLGALQALLSLPASAALQGPELVPSTEIFEGMVVDVAGPDSTDAATASGQRFWAASGRVRTAVRVSDRQRMLSEDAVFDRFEPPRKEQVLALELNEVRNELFTLTDSGIYREDVSDASNPTLLAAMSFDDALIRTVQCLPLCTEHDVPFPMTEEELDPDVLDIKVWTGPDTDADRLILMTSKRVVIVRWLEDIGGDPGDPPEYMFVQSYAGELFDSPTSFFTPAYTGSPPLYLDADVEFNDTKVNKLLKLRVALDSDGKLIAYVMANAAQFQGVIPGARSGAQVLMACDLDHAGSFAEPTFNAGAPGLVEYRWWEPDWDSPTTARELRQRTMYDFDVYSDGTSRFAVIAMGCANQLAKVDVTTAFTSPALCGEGTNPYKDVRKLCTVDSWDDVSTSSNCGTQFAGDDHFFAVKAHPMTPDLFFACSREALHLVDATGASPTFVQSSEEPTAGGNNFTRSAKRDLVLMYTNGELGFEYDPTPPSGQLSLWMVAFSPKMDHPFKIFDVTDSLASPLHLLEEGYAAGATDGAVALPGSLHVYLPTFGGIVRCEYDPVSGDWNTVPESYQPAEADVPLVGRVSRNTEHITLGKAAGLDRVFTISGARNELMDYPINAITGDPGDVVPFPPNPALLDNGDPCPTPIDVDPWPWVAQEGLWYSNDVEFLDFSPSDPVDGKFALTIITWQAPTYDQGQGPESACASTGDCAQHALVAYQWEDPTGWFHVESAFSGLIEDPGPGPAFANVINLIEAHGTTWAFVGHRRGFFWVDVGRLGDATPTLEWDCDAHGSVSSGGNQVLWGDSDRPTVVTGIDDGAGTVRLFAFSSSRNTLRIYDWDDTGNPQLTLVNEYESDDALWGGLMTAPKPIRVRYHERTNGSGGEGYIICATEPNLLLLEWPGTATPTADHVDLVGHWSGDWNGLLSDARPYDFGPTAGGWQILAAKHWESCAFIPFAGD